jgi:hypothetical protein
MSDGIKLEALKQELREACGSSKRGWATLQLLRRSLDAIEKLEKELKGNVKIEKRKLCHCCHKREADKYDPEGRCGHADCIPF